jgi:hypothetical protein
MLEIVNGRTMRGRLTVRLPGGRQHWAGWEDVNWQAVGRDVGRAAATAWMRDAGRGLALGGLAGLGAQGPGPLLDDIVVSVDLLRTTARLPKPTTGAGPAVAPPRLPAALPPTSGQS